MSKIEKVLQNLIFHKWNSEKMKVYADSYYDECRENQNYVRYRHHEIMLYYKSTGGY